MKKIAILTGWPGYERNIALKSVKLFEKHINREYETFLLPEALDAFISRREEFEKVIPVFHGEYGEDGRIQALLDVYNIPYVGSSYAANALCMNKKQANIVAAVAGLSVPQEMYISKTETFHKDTFTLTFPVIVKPNKGWSSYYTYKVENIEKLREKIEYMQQNISDDILVQEYILWDEYSVSVVNGEILPAIMWVEKNNEEDFFDYESKYETESGMRETFPEIDPAIRTQLESATKLAEKIFNVTWYFRVDFIVRDRVAYFLEINTIPGTAEVSILPKAWKLSGRSLEEFIEEILK